MIPSPGQQAAQGVPRVDSAPLDTDILPVCGLTEEELWSGLDRESGEIAAHLEVCAICRNRAGEFRAGISTVAQAARVPAPPMPATIGTYLIHRRLGEGGMGTVFEAEQQSPKRLVAIKVIRGGRQPDDYRVRLFEREAQTLARLKHPGIAAVYEGGRTSDGEPFFAMELVRGEPLTDYVRSRKIARRRRLELFRRIAEAIHYAHLRGVIHRDLKPTNILVDDDGNPKILDFGLARIIDPESAITTTAHEFGKIMGTLPYMSPEEAKGAPEEIDVRSDVYSLGVILYELLTDQLPYTVRRAALAEAVRTICEDPPRRPSAIDRSLRGDLENIALKALEKDPQRRYQSAAALADDVDRYLTNRPILARAPSFIYQARKFAVRHRFFVMFLLGLFGITLYTRIWVEQEEQRRRAGIEKTLELKDLSHAMIGERLALAYRDLGQYDQAEPHFENAIAIYLRNDRTEWAMPALVELGKMLIARSATATEKEAVYVQAEDALVRAIEIFNEGNLGEKQRASVKTALEALATLYSPAYWNDAEAMTRVQSELKKLDDASLPPQITPERSKRGI